MDQKQGKSDPKDVSGRTPDDDILFHGTSLANWDRIRADGAMIPGPFGHPHVSLTTNPYVARYFAELAVGLQEGGIPTGPVILAVRRSDLEREGLSPAPFVDGVWGEEDGCDWEREEAVGNPIPAWLFHAIEFAGFETALSRAEIIAMRSPAEPDLGCDSSP